MSRHPLSQVFVAVALSFSFVAASALVRPATGAPNDVVDLQADPQAKTPAGNDKDSPAPATGTDKAIRAEQEREAEGAAKLKLRAGEDGRGQSQVLGMSIQEAGQDRVKVVDVAMNSPAFDAGVMKGDELLYFQGFRGENYRKWIDGIRRVTTDTASGLSIPVVVSRGGKQVTVQVRMPDKIVRVATNRALPQPATPAGPPALGQASPAAGAGGPTAVNNVAVSDVGPFADFFAGNQASPNEHAVAHIMRIGGQSTPKAANPAGDTTPGGAAAPANGGARVGMAGFRDDPSGMVVMLDVSSLTAGTYSVVITDASAVGGATLTSPQQLNANPAGGNQPSNGAAPSAPTIPGQPQGSTTPSEAQIPRTVLAQVASPGRAGTIDAVPSAGGTTVPPAAQTGGIDAADPNVKAHKTGAGGGRGTPSQIGTLTVDKTGTGRMQQRVEGLQVRNVVGQAIVIYPQAAAAAAQSPPQANSKATAGTSGKPGVTDSVRTSPTPDDASADKDPTGLGSAPATPVPAGQAPVAGGIIQLSTNRRPPVNEGTDPTRVPVGADAPGQQPATATPPATQGLER